ncbi:MAG: hypothetical protein AB7E55_16840 [Pigmentiphaga sp.]
MFPIGDTLPSVITTLPNLLPMHRNGRLRILAISTDEPLDALPDVATFKELGFPDLVINDHGDNLGARGLWGKSTLYQESVGIPMLLAGAGGATPVPPEALQSQAASG